MAHPLWPHGASARGNPLLTYYGIGNNYLDFIVDKNTLKHGLYSPNLHIPIKPVDAIKIETPDLLFVHAWNFLDEIYSQKKEFSNLGEKFLIPLPELRLVE